ncbi:hypothetical protein [Kitasatospora albolonga]|uniref:hypothetical protein n=1 Tax=Kitasatospora albolonga TaxID=68173 RepID=UPI0031EFD202
MRWPGRRPLHLPRLPRVRPGRARGRGGAAGRPRHRLGILRSDPLSHDTDHHPVSEAFGRMSAPVRAKAHEKKLLVLTKANSKSTVHRPAYLDYVGVKRFDAQGT